MMSSATRVMAVFLISLACSVSTQAFQAQVGDALKHSNTQGWSVPLADGDRLGLGVAYLGDLDGAGSRVLAVSSGEDPGVVYLLFLDADGNVTSHTKFGDGIGGFTGTLFSGDSLGSSLAAPGDVDGDGVPDLAVAASGDGGVGNAGCCRGAVWIVFLNADGTVKGQVELGSGQNGKAALADTTWFGASLAPLGDHDGNGVPDIAVGGLDDEGGPDQGAVWILFLNSDGTVKAEQKINGVQGGFGGTLDNFDAFGRGLDFLGDFNDDGVGDLAVGARGDGDGGSNRGAIWLVYLNADGTVKGETKISDTSGWVSDVLANGDSLGQSVENPGDLDGDGVTDLLSWNPGTGEGGYWALYLNSDGTVKAHQEVSATKGCFEGPLDAGDAFGYGLETLGDLDGDGRIDLACTAYNDDDGGTDRGAVYLLEITDDLVLSAIPESPATGDQLTFRVCGGNPGGLVMLVTVAVNNVPFFFPITISAFDGDGEWQYPILTPAVVSGLSIDFLAFGQHKDGPNAATNVERVDF